MAIFNQLSGRNNPVDGVGVFTSAPAFADIDGDGDLDAILGNISGTLRFFENTG